MPDGGLGATREHCHGAAYGDAATQKLVLMLSPGRSGALDGADDYGLLPRCALGLRPPLRG